MSSPSSVLDDLVRAAKENDVDSLYKSIQNDPEILKRINDIPFVDTPLHVAASSGNTLFVVEIMALMPSFCRKLNCNGLSPLHIALQNGRLETARHMIRLDGGLIRVPGRRKMTAMHYLVSISDDNDENKVELLIDFLKACPEAVMDLTTECKTPMHVAVDSKSFDAFGVVYGWLWRTGNIGLLDMEDINGDTALRMAAQLTHEYPKLMERPIIREGFRRICKSREQIIGNSNKKKGLNRRKFFLSSETTMQKIIRLSAHMHKGLSMDMRNVVLVVAVLVATAVYQATLAPPSGVTQVTSSIVPMDLDSENLNLPPIAPTVIVHQKRFVLFLFMNTLAFNLALGVMLFVLPFGLYSVFVHLALYFMSVSFLVLLDILAKEHRTMASVLMYLSLALFGITYTARFLISFLKMIVWLPWWYGMSYRIMYKLISCMNIHEGFQELHMQMETVGWSGDTHGSYYSG